MSFEVLCHYNLITEKMLLDTTVNESQVCGGTHGLKRKKY